MSLWTVAHEAPLSMGPFQQAYWSGLSFLSPGGLPDPGIKPGSLLLAGEFFTTEAPGKPSIYPPLNKFYVGLASYCSLIYLQHLQHLLILLSKRMNVLGIHSRKHGWSGQEECHWGVEIGQNLEGRSDFGEKWFRQAGRMMWATTCV